MGSISDKITQLRLMLQTNSFVALSIFDKDVSVVRQIREMCRLSNKPH